MVEYPGQGKMACEMPSDEDPAVGSEGEDKPLSSKKHSTRRPMNAFLIFCKRHRPVVRATYPSLENRGVTRVLGEWWAQLDSVDKDSYTQLAKQYKEAFLRANPDFKWYKLPPPSTPPSNMTSATTSYQNNAISKSVSGKSIVPGKLADESQLGGLSSLLGKEMSGSAAVPPKKRYANQLHNAEKGETSRAEEPVATIRTSNQQIINLVVDRLCAGDGLVARRKRGSNGGGGSDDSSSSFDLDERIDALPPLSLEAFLHRKSKHKRRKQVQPVAPPDGSSLPTPLVGSRKRKARKQSITRVVHNQEESSGLATLAEVAAKETKLTTR